MRKLCVAGCSVSDYVRIKAYGETLAEKLGMQYIHEGAGCGSNHRIWRKITKYVQDSFLTSNDILVIQYTECTRNEFWSFYGDVKRSLGNDMSDNSHDNGVLIRYKQDAASWQPVDVEKDFFLLYEKYFVNYNYALEQFNVLNYNFQHMLKNHNMKVIFLKTTRIGPQHDYVLDHFISSMFIDESNRLPENNMSDIDKCHWSQLGSDLIAENLYNHIKQLTWI